MQSNLSDSWSNITMPAPEMDIDKKKKKIGHQLRATKYDAQPLPPKSRFYSVY